MARPRWAPEMGIDQGQARFWRRALSAVLGVDALALVVQTSWKASQAPALAGDSPIFAALAAAVPALALVAMVALVALWRFARAPARWLPLLVALTALGVLVEANGLVFHDYNRNYFFPGAMAAAWCAGLLFARLVGLAGDPEEAERLASAGSVAMLGVAYLNAGTSKLLYSAGEWLNPAVIRLTLVMENPVDDTSWMAPVWQALVAQPDLAAELAIMAVVMELCGVLYVFGWRGRAFAGSVMLALHLGMWTLLHIVFVDAVACLVLFSYPWPRLWQRLRSKPAEAPSAAGPALPLGRTVKAALLVALVAGSVWLLPGAGVARSGSVHATGEGATGPVLLRSFGPVRVGDAVAAGWVVMGLRVEGGAAAIEVGREPQERVTLFVGGPEGPVQPGPFAAWPARVAHGPIPVGWEEFEPVGAVLAARIQAALGGDASLIARWLQDVEDSP